MMQSSVLFADASYNLLEKNVQMELYFLLSFVLKLLADKKEADILLVAIERREIDM
jgi:hypothetical protein